MLKTREKTVNSNTKRNTLFFMEMPLRETEFGQLVG